MGEALETAGGLCSRSRRLDRPARPSRSARCDVMAVKFKLVSGAEFVKTLEIEGVQMEQVQRAIEEFKGQVDPWIEVDDGAWIRLDRRLPRLFAQWALVGGAPSPVEKGRRPTRHGR